MVLVLARPATGADTAGVAAADPLANVNFAVGDIELFGGPAGVVSSADRGSWSFERGRMVNGRLELHLRITPTQPTMPLKSGPAVLFAGLDLYGDAGGDVGMGVSVGPIVQTVVPACADDAACHYEVDVSIPTAELPKAIASLEKNGDLIWVSADLTLVRTFGGGEWLQVLALAQGPLGIQQAAAGRLGAMEPTHGDIVPTGLFPAIRATPTATGNGNLGYLDYRPIVEALRSKAGDDTTAGPMVDVALHVEIHPICRYWTELTLHDRQGNFLFYANENVEHPVIDESTRMPAASPWYLRLDGGDGGDPLVELGPIQPDGSGSPLAINATIDCSKPAGTMTLTGAAMASPIPTRRPLSSVGPLAPTIAPTATAPTVHPRPLDEIPHPEWAVVVIGLFVIAFVVVGRRRRANRS